jgi:uncharacterized protein YegL
VSDRVTEGQLVMPFYIICDVSGSMNADMNDLNRGIAELRDGIKQDPVADDLTMLSVIAFSDTASTVVPLNFPTAITLQPMKAGGLTNYTAAFQEFHRAFEADKARLKSEGKRIFRPCVFFITDGVPTSKDHLTVFQQLFGYDPKTGQGNSAYPYVTLFGFRQATEETLKGLAYPTFGEKKGRYFLHREGASVSGLLKAMTGIIATSVLNSSQSAASGAPVYTPPAAEDSPEMTVSIVG